MSMPNIKSKTFDPNKKIALSEEAALHLLERFELLAGLYRRNKQYRDWRELKKFNIELEAALNIGDGDDPFIVPVNEYDEDNEDEVEEPAKEHVVKVVRAFYDDHDGVLTEYEPSREARVGFNESYSVARLLEMAGEVYKRRENEVAE